MNAYEYDAMSETIPVKENNKNGGTEVVPNNVEASESDPCMDYKKNKRRRSEWWQETEQMLLKRTGLHQRALYYVMALLLVLMVLLVVVVAMAATWPRTPHRYLFPACEDPSCLRAAAQVCCYVVGLRFSITASGLPCE